MSHKPTPRNCSHADARWFEALEPRVLLSGSPESLAAQGFAPVLWQGQEVYAQPGQWIVKINGVRGQAAEQLAAVNAKLQRVRKDATATRHLGADGLVLVETPANMTQAQLKRSLSRLRAVRLVEPDFALWTSATLTNDTSFSSLWGLHNTGQTGGTVDADIDAPEAWDLSLGAGVIVGVIDTGIDYTHADLYLNLWINQAEVPAAVRQAIMASPGWDVTGDGTITFRDLNDPRNQGPGKITDQNGDGRIDARDIMAAWKSDGTGGWATGADTAGNGFIDDLVGYNFYNDTANPVDDHGHGTHVSGTIAAVGDNGQGVVGVSWGAQVMALKFLNAQGSGTTSGAIAAVNYATRMRQQHGVDVRVTNNSWGGGGYSQALHDAIKASGDAGMLFVAAAGNGGSDGKGDDNDATPHYPASYNLANILAVAATDHNDKLASFSNYGATSVDLAAPGVSILSTTPGNNYAKYNGTSMATPHVSGAAALAWAYAPDATWQTVREALLQGVDTKSSLGGKVASGGRLNAYGALLHLGAAPAPEPAPAPTVPAAPSSLAASAASSSRIDLGWADNASDEQGFYVYRSSDGVQFTRIVTLGANATGYSDSGLAASTTYTYLVRAFNDAGESAASNHASATTLAGLSAPAAPGNLVATTLSNSQIHLDWSDNSDNEDGFYLERSTNGRNWSRIAAVNAGTTSFTDSGLRRKTRYHYRVAAYNSAGVSDYSQTATATTANSLRGTAAAALAPARPQPSNSLAALLSSDVALRLTLLGI